MNEEPPIAQAFYEIALLGKRLGVENVGAMQGCWEHQIDDHWWIALNGHDTPTLCSKADNPIEPFTAYLEYNGLPAGIVDTYGGCFVRLGDRSGEDVFIEALQKAAPLEIIVEGQV